MSTRYRAVQWNRQKRAYDAVLAVGVLGFLAVFAGTGALLFPDVTPETLLIRGLGSVAFVLLHVILCIGPLCRLMPRFLPLLYNRRHLGVTMFALALAHAVLSAIQFHALGDSDVLASVLAANPRLDSISQFPFQPFGLAALAILFAMAATSHDFWLANLTAPVWKALHMGVYLAYGLVVLHVGLGVLQSELNPVYPLLVLLGMVLVLGLHLAGARREHAIDTNDAADATTSGRGRPEDGFVAICRVDDIEEKRARIAMLGGERVAVFRYDGKLSAVSNVCQHQNGPLGEGQIVDGCITCPWHGYQYEPHSGRAPAPFRERIPTFRVRVADGTVYVHPRPNPPGTPVEPATIPDTEGHAGG